MQPHIGPEGSHSETDCSISRPAARNAKSLKSSWVDDCRLTIARTFKIDLDPQEPMSGPRGQLGSLFVRMTAQWRLMQGPSRSILIRMSPCRATRGPLGSLFVRMTARWRPMQGPWRSILIRVSPCRATRGPLGSLLVRMTARWRPMQGPWRSILIRVSPCRATRGPLGSLFA